MSLEIDMKYILKAIFKKYLFYNNIKKNIFFYLSANFLETCHNYKHIHYISKIIFYINKVVKKKINTSAIFK